MLSERMKAVRLFESIKADRKSLRLRYREKGQKKEKVPFILKEKEVMRTFFKEPSHFYHRPVKKECLFD